MQNFIRELIINGKPRDTAPVWSQETQNTFSEYNVRINVMVGLSKLVKGNTFFINASNTYRGVILVFSFGETIDNSISIY